MQNSILRRSLFASFLLGVLGCSANIPETVGSTGGYSGEGGKSTTGGRGGGATGSGGSPGTAGGVGIGGVSGSSSGTTGFGAGTSAGGRLGAAGSIANGGRPQAVGGAGSGGGARSGGGAGSGGMGAGGSTVGMAGAGGMYVGTKTPGMAQSGDVTVDPAKTYQVVDGFGEADVWQNSSSTAMQTLLFDPVNGIGLTLLRIGIDGTSGQPKIMGSAAFTDGPAVVKFGGKVWAAPWSPPANMKDNNNVNNGGHLQTSDYSAWAKVLAAFPAYYKQMSGVDLYALSAQNEPDFTASYQSCLFSASQMVAWIDVLGPMLAALSPPVKVVAAEPDNWGNIWSGDGYGPAILADSAASSYVGPIATHDYGNTSAGTYGRPAPPANNTHHVWETEATPSGTGAITIATMIYAAFATGGVSAWHYWWTESLVPNASSPPAQVYALGNFSKFVRPGYLRADVSGAPKASGTVPLVVAFTNTSDGTVVIVVVNGGGAQQVSFFVSGTAWPASVTPNVTTSSSKLAAGTAIPVSAGRFSASLEAQSVTTFVGKP